ncbi:MAG: His/Gly/Thr/Pro-type tRNA ligase C-terminal domain-containing protein [Candidatus Sumerlaeota bacterium]
MTVDPEGEEDGCVTVRHRDTMDQDRVAIEKVPEFCQDKLDKMREEFTRP